MVDGLRCAVIEQPLVVLLISVGAVDFLGVLHPKNSRGAKIVA